MNGRDRHSGFTLVELLVVMAIIVLISSVTVPSMMRSGMFGGNPTDAAARDLFAQLRGAHVYATTHNVDTAIAYGVSTPSDSIFDTGILSDFVPVAYPATNANAPVLDSSIIVRRLTIQELNEADSGNPPITLAQYIIAHDNDDEYSTYNELTAEIPFIPVKNAFGSFQPLTSDTCLLTNDPAMLVNDNTYLANTGLYKPDLPGIQGIAIFRIDKTDGLFSVDRVLPKISDDTPNDSIFTSNDRGFPQPAAPPLNYPWTNRFPAHVFKRTGGLDDSGTTRQRISLAVGLLPDQDYFDRFMVNEDSGLIYTQDEYHSIPSPDNPDFSGLVGRETDIEIYIATGRVKVAQDDE